MTFCPHCGMDMTKRQCPACSTELDVHWRFCVTCGRSADLPDIATPIRRAS
jgi:predicted amidophosphoribosyltransferase